MKRVFLTALITILFLHIVEAQNIKTGVLVIGEGNSAAAASIQSGNSGVTTVWLMPGDDFGVSLQTKEDPSGILQRLLNSIRKTSNGNEDPEKLFNDNARINSALKTWTDTIKKLTIIKGANWYNLKRSGSGWQLELKDGRKIKAMTLINADRSEVVNKALALADKKDQWHPLNYKDNLYRTSVGAGQAIGSITNNIIFISDLLVPGQENLVALNPQANSFAAGQAAGAIASYAAFFKKKTSEAQIKTVQGELLYYDLCLIPFSDIKPADSNWKAIQFLGLSGFLKGDIKNGRVNFNPDQFVLTEEIKGPIKEFYYKAQIWFDDHKEPTMTIGSTLDLVCYAGGKSPKSTELEVRKNWKTVFKFKTEFDPNRAITRREFAVLVNDYLKPFNVNIDQTGRVLR